MISSRSLEAVCYDGGRTFCDERGTGAEEEARNTLKLAFFNAGAVMVDCLSAF